LSESSITAEGTKELAQALQGNTTLTQLRYASVGVLSFLMQLTPTHSLQENCIGDEGAKALGQALRDNASLTVLMYVRARVCECVRVCVLQTLGSHLLYSLGRNAIGDEGARALCEALQKNTALTHLKCVCVPVSPFLPTGRFYRSLLARSLSNNRISDEGAVSCVEALGHSSGLVHLK
jgi:Ran GTPase-activating protein (RanGAP) involved in mRNA processing and transport